MALVLTIHNSEKTICQIVDHVLMPKKRSSSRIEKQPLKVFLTKMLLNFFQNSQERTCARASFLIKLSAKTCNFIKKETLGKAFCYEFCKISNKKNSLKNSSVGCFQVLHSNKERDQRSKRNRFRKM